MRTIDKKGFGDMKNKIKGYIKNYQWNIGILVIIFFIMLPIMYRFSLINLDPNHQGFLFKTSYDVAHGKTLFKETFTMYGALTIYIQAFFIRLFGDTIAAINLSACMALCVAYYFMYLIVKRFCNTGIAFISTGIIFLVDYTFLDTFHPWSSIYALMILTMMIYALIKFADTDKVEWLYFFSVLTALSFWARQPVGLVMLLGMVIVLVIYPIFYNRLSVKKIVGCIVCYVAVHVLFLGRILIEGAFHDFWIQSIKGTLGFNESKNIDDSMFSNLISSLFPVKIQSIIWSILPSVLLFSFLVLFMKIVRDKIKGKNINKNVIALIFFIIFSVASWHQYYPIADVRHVFWSAVPMIGCFCTVVYLFCKLMCSGIQKKYIKPSVIAVMVIVMFFGKYMFYNVKSGINKFNEKRTAYFNEHYTIINGLYLTEEQADFQNKLVTVMEELKEKYPDKNVVNLTMMNTYTYFQNYNFHPEFFPLEHIDYDYHSIVTKYVGESLPIIICYERDWATWGYAGYVEYAGISGNDSNIYWDNGVLGIYIPSESPEVNILPDMYTEHEVEKNESQVLLNAGEAYSYGTRYYTEGVEYTVQIEIECAEGSCGVLQAWENWHSNMVQEAVLNNGVNEVKLDGEWDNATLSICAVNGDMKIKSVKLITQFKK